jgi:hypothetical protein
MAGLDPAIQTTGKRPLTERLDGRLKGGHDELIGGASGKVR